MTELDPLADATIRVGVVNAIDTVAGISQELYDRLIEIAVAEDDLGVSLDMWSLSCARVHLKLAFTLLRNSVATDPSRF
jgi:hypothetical protein